MSYIKQFLALCSVFASLAIVVVAGAPHLNPLDGSSAFWLSQLSALLYLSAALICGYTLLRSRFKSFTLMLGLASIMGAIIETGVLSAVLSELTAYATTLLASLYATSFQVFEKTWEMFPNALLLGALVAAFLGLLTILRISESLALILKKDEHVQFVGLLYLSVGLLAMAALASAFAPSHPLLVVLTEVLKVSAAAGCLFCSVAVPRFARAKRAPESLATFSSVKGC